VATDAAGRGAKDQRASLRITLVMQVAMRTRLVRAARAVMRLASGYESGSAATLTSSSFR